MKNNRLRVVANIAKIRERMRETLDRSALAVMREQLMVEIQKLKELGEA